jgi:hypothetical protein
MTVDIWKVSLLILLLSLLELYLLFRCAKATLRHRRISSLTPVSYSTMDSWHPGEGGRA